MDPFHIARRRALAAVVLAMGLAVAGCTRPASYVGPVELGQPSVVHPGPAFVAGNLGLHTAAVGTTLRTTDGTWTGRVTSYTYQWARCDLGGANCTNLAGATSQAYTVQPADAGSTIRVTVTAHRTSDATSRASFATSVISSDGTATTSRGGGDLSTYGCFPSPGACGYPDPNYAWIPADNAWATGGGGVGPQNGGVAEPCSSLPNSGSVTSSRDGQVISDLNIVGTLRIQNANVTVENVCVTANGGAALGSYAVDVTAPGAVIDNSTIAGANLTSGSVEIGVRNFGGSSNVVTMKHDYVHDCGECLNTGSWNVSDSYIVDNGMYGTSDHLEVAYIDGGGNTATFTHDTLYSPPGYTNPASPLGYQASLLFGDTNGGSGGNCSTKWDVSNSLLAGDGYILTQCGNSSSVGSSTLTFTGNVIARCHGLAAQTGDGNWYCTDLGVQNGNNANRGGDGYGFFPAGGSYGVADAYCGSATWSSNIWDDNGSSVGC